MNILSLFPDSWKERLRLRAGAVTLSGRLQNLRRAGFSPARIIDAGAYRGDWTRTARAIFPSASILMIEPQPQLAAGLRRLCAGRPGLSFRPSALGATTEKIQFLLEETNSRILAGRTGAAAPGRVCELETELLSAVAEQEGFGACDLLKLDLQGHELPALAGAGAMFGQVEVIITEASFLPIGVTVLVPEVMEVFHRHGYQLYDIFGFNYRPRDGALWQADLVFARKNSALLAEQHRWL